MYPIAFVDLETTGARPNEDRITEIGIVFLEADGQCREWQQLVNPQQPIIPFIESLTGISNAMVATAPCFAELAEALQRQLQGHFFVAHNARFDFSFLQAEFSRVGMPFDPSVLCTVKLSRALYPEHKKHGLDALIQRHDLRVSSRHRALADARLIHQFWQKIHVDRSTEDITTAIVSLNPYPNLSPEISSRIFEQIPQSPGRCFLHAADGRLIYSSRCPNLHKRITQRFAARNVSEAVKQQLLLVREIAWECDES